MAAVLGAIVALGSMATLGLFLAKTASWLFVKTPAQTDSEIEKANQDAKHQAQDTGRPVA